MKYILGIDQGTSGTKALIFDERGKAVAKGAEALKTAYLENGFVEQDPEAIFQNVLSAVSQCLLAFKSAASDSDNGAHDTGDTRTARDMRDIRAVGISNQRETFVVWDKNGVPLSNAIVWQCKRSIDICARWKSDGYEEPIRSRTGLLIDPYFSASKLVWLYQNDDKIRRRIDAGEAFFGTIDTWLLYKLTNGASYYTDYTNASRTLLFNIKELRWDDHLLNVLDLTKINLPEPKPSAWSFGQTDFGGLLSHPIDITGMIGDSHAAAFGEGCFSPGEAKATLGTGCSILMNTGAHCMDSQNGMVTTICWSTEGMVHYALEGVIVTCGATLEWLRNELNLFTDARQTEAMARSVDDNGGVYLVPAFSGLGAPHWQMDRKASLSGLTFGTQKNHIVRAALESIPYQIKDVIVAMELDTKIPLQQLMVDGGISANAFVTQFLADLLEKEVVTIGQPEISALGAAYMAGLKAGVYENIGYLKTLNNDKKVFSPSGDERAAEAYRGWLEALRNKA